VPGYNLQPAVESLHGALIPCADARIVALTRNTNWVTSLFGKTSLLAVVEYAPAA
jgi:hypothetical protein